MIQRKLIRTRECENQQFNKLTSVTCPSFTSKEKKKTHCQPYLRKVRVASHRPSFDLSDSQASQASVNTSRLLTDTPVQSLLPFTLISWWPLTLGRVSLNEAKLFNLCTVLATLCMRLKLNFIQKHRTRIPKKCLVSFHGDQMYLL